MDSLVDCACPRNSIQAHWLKVNESQSHMTLPIWPHRQTLSKMLSHIMQLSYCPNSTSQLSPSKCRMYIIIPQADLSSATKLAIFYMQNEVEHSTFKNKWTVYSLHTTVLHTVWSVNFYKLDILNNQKLHLLACRMLSADTKNLQVFIPEVTNAGQVGSHFTRLAHLSFRHFTCNYSIESSTCRVQVDNFIFWNQNIEEITCRQCGHDAGSEQYHGTVNTWHHYPNV